MQKKLNKKQEEIRLKQVSEDNLNGRLAMAFPEHTLKSIKGLHKQAVYSALTDDMV